MRVSISARVRRPADLVAKVVTDPEQLLPLMTGFGRFQHRDGDLWEVFMPVGTFQVGGVVAIEHPDAYSIAWSSRAGMEHDFAITVTPQGDDARIELSVSYRLRGLVMAKLSEVLARGVVVRHLEAAAEEIRHHLEWNV